MQLEINKVWLSSYFRQKDKQQMQEFTQKIVQNKFYRSIISKWKKPLERKKLRKLRLSEIEHKKKQPEKQKLVVHNPALGIQYPPKQDQIFCVIKIDDRQYKVTKNCVLILDTKPQHQVNHQIIFNQVLLVGTNTYTVIGRPTLGYTTVQANVQQISKSYKVIVFKKKRRKQYKKSFGSRVSLTSVRITNIAHEINQQTLNSAVRLQ